MEEANKKKTIDIMKKIEKAIIITIAGIALTGIIALLFYFIFIPSFKYKKALSLLMDGKYSEAYEKFDSLDGYSDSEIQLERISAITEISNSEFDEGIEDILNTNAVLWINYIVSTDSGDEVKKYVYESADAYDGLLEFEKPGYKLEKWIYESCEYDAESNTIQLYLKAVWNETQYFITYNLDGGELTDEQIVSGYVMRDKDIIIGPATKKGYTFLGWTGTDIEGMIFEITIPAGSYGDRVYTANWLADQYVIKFDSNGGDVPVSDLRVTYEAEVVLPIPRKDGYTFLGWFDGNTKVTDGIWRISRDTSLVARWEIEEYQITYDCAGVAAFHDNSVTYTIESEDMVLSDAYAEGYTFEGWYRDSSYVEKVDSIPADLLDDVVLYAKWKIITYTVEYELNGGTCPETLVTTYTVLDLPLALPIPTRESYNFICWEEKDMLGKVMTEITECKNYTLSACFILNGLTFFTSDDETYCVIGKYNGSQVKVEIPAYFRLEDGRILPVRAIGDSAFYDTQIEEIILPDTIAAIGDYAFCNCTKLTYVILPEALESIGYMSFRYCSSLKEIEIPGTLTTIHGSAFTYSATKKIVYGGTVAQWRSMFQYSYMQGDFNSTVYCTDGTIGYNGSSGLKIKMY